MKQPIKNRKEESEKYYDKKITYQRIHRSWNVSKQSL